MKTWHFKKLVIKFILLALEKCLPTYLSLKFTEKQFSTIVLKNYATTSLDQQQKLGILLQGPIILEDNFTLNTLALYKHIYPKSVILLSTWDIENPKEIESIEKFGITVLRNKKPEFFGTQNINLQLTSTKAGLNYLKEKQVDYVLKCRTDQRITKHIDFIKYFINLLKQFPSETTTALRNRLVITGLNSFEHRLYGVTDMLMFGNIDDMRLYWNIDLQQEAVVLLEESPRYFIKNNIAEGYLVNTFFRKLNFTPNWSEENSNHFLKSFFLIIDKEQLDLFWYKYQRHFENYCVLDGDEQMQKKNLTFADWLMM